MRRASRDARHGRGHLTAIARRTVLAIAAVAVIAGIAAYVLRPTTDPREEGGIAEIDEPFAGLQGEAVVGAPVDSATMDWSVLVVNVWATWCEPCRREQPALQRVQADHDGQNVEFLGVNYRDDRAAAQAATATPDRDA